jgi:dihydrofolate synthase / folylpolyglutamate synthase
MAQTEKSVLFIILHTLKFTMTYLEVLDYMYRQLPMFYRIGQSAYKANLDNAVALDKYFGNPHRNYMTIHVAGTNGKGSVSHMLAGILQKAGYRTGLFTSPHLKDFRERIRVNGEMILEKEVVRFIENHLAILDTVKPSFFEMTSALAFQYFSDVKADVAVIEVGLGGRLDSTNIITPALSVITNIGFDHMELLGNTLDKIAKEKAGIMKRGVPVVIGEYHQETWPVFEQVAQLQDSPITLAEKEYQVEYSLFTPDQKQVFTVYKNSRIAYRDLKIDLLGFYQRKNISTVLTAIDQLRAAGFHIPGEAIYEALAGTSEITGLTGRWQILGNNPLIVCDTGHNKDGIHWVTEQIRAVPYRQLHMVIGFVKDKDVSAILEQLPRKATYYFTRANIPRALDAGELKEMAVTFGLYGNSFATVIEALDTAKENAAKDDFIFVGGSTFVVAEVV